MKRKLISALLAVLTLTSCGPSASSSTQSTEESGQSQSSSPSETPEIEILRFTVGESLTLEVGESERLTYEAENVEGEIAFSSSDEEVAAVDGEGNVIAVNPGSADITISADGLSDVVTIVVEAAPYVEFTNLEAFDAGVGYTITTIVNSGNSDEKVGYASSDETLATVSEEGVVTCLSEGTVTITATLEEAVDSISIDIHPCTDWSLLPHKEVEVDGVKGIGLIYDESDPLGVSGATEAIVPPEKDGLPVLSIGGPYGDTPFFYLSDLKVFAFPETVTSICDNTLGYTGIERLYIHNKMVTIEKNGLEHMESLKALYLPDSVVNLADDFVSMCPSLETLRLPASYKGLPYLQETGISSWAIPDGITSIPGGNFRDCAKLESVSIPDSVVSIGSRSFENCVSLKSVEIPDSVTQIDLRAFMGTNSLKNVFIPASVTTMGNYIFLTSNEEFEIYCEAESKPDGWSDTWIGKNDLGGYEYKVHWGASREEVPA